VRAIVEADATVRPPQHLLLVTAARIRHYLPGVDYQELSVAEYIEKDERRRSKRDSHTSRFVT